MDTPCLHHVAVRGAASALAGVGQATSMPGRLPGDPGRIKRFANLYLVETPDPAATGPRPVNLPGIAHLCLQTRDADPALATLAATGGRLIAPPEPLGTGFHYAYGHDERGRLFEIETAPFLPAAPTVWAGHVALVSRSAARLAGFYGALLETEVTVGGRFAGHKGIDRVAGLEDVDVEVWWVRSPPVGIEVWQYRNPPPPAEGDSTAWYCHLGIAAPDLAAACARIESIGGVAGPAVAGPAGDFAWARDPDGNRLLLFALDAGHAAGLAWLPAPGALAAVAAARIAAR